MLDEETGAEPRIVSASIADPFLLLVRDDSSIFVAQIDVNNELEEVERENDGLLANKWLTGCLYTDTRGVFANLQNDKDTRFHDTVLMFLVNASGALHVSPCLDVVETKFLTLLDIRLA
jgi:cleavage and polyadenylation specificity factor subunit 1